MTVREYFTNELKIEEWRSQTEEELIDSLIDSHRTLRNYRLEQDKKNKEKLDEQTWIVGYPKEKGIYWIFYILESISTTEGKEIGTEIDIFRISDVDEKKSSIECSIFDYDMSYHIDKRDFIAYIPIKRPKVFHRGE